MNEPLPAKASTVEIQSIAIIDNDYRKVSVDRLPEPQRDEARAAVDGLEGDSRQDLVDRGVQIEGLADELDRLDALTDPEYELGDAFAHLLSQCDALGKLIQDRYSMRRLAAHIRTATNADVHELAPEDVPDDLSTFELVFLDYYLEDGSNDTSTAEDIASRAASSCTSSQQQLILMSSDPNVRSDRRKFRSTSRVPGPSFAFVSKPELDATWKIKAHLKMLAKALPHSRAIYGYISSVKEYLDTATKELGLLLDDLDLGDLAHLQNLALQADGHPLGDYLSWLVSSHLTSLTFEGDLRTKQDEVDSIEFDTTLVHPLELSGIITTFHHSALFSRNLGPLRGHPRAVSDPDRPQLPFARLGDVYFDQDRSRALVILSADCQLSFAPGTKRSLDESTPVLLVPGTPLPVHKREQGAHHAATYGIEHKSEIYRIEWNFKKYFSTSVGALQAKLVTEGFDISNRDRLRPLYALQLQYQFANFLFTVGSPIPPPARVPVKATLVRYIPNSTKEDEPTPETVYEFEDDDIHATLVNKGISIRLTLAVSERLRQAVEELYQDGLDLLENGNEANDVRHLRPKVEAIGNHLDSDDKWVSILGDHLLPKTGKVDNLLNGLLLISDSECPAPQEPVVLLNVVVLDTGKESSI